MGSLSYVYDQEARADEPRQLVDGETAADSSTRAAAHVELP